MLSDQAVADLRSVLALQHRVTQDMQAAISEADRALADVPAQNCELAELERQLTELERDAAWLAPEDFAGFAPDRIAQLYAERQNAIKQHLTRIEFTDWSTFVHRCQEELLHRGADPFAPYEALLTDANWDQLNRESYEAKYRWDQWDYAVVGVAGVLGALSDLLLVKTPSTSVLTQKLKAFKFDKATQDWLEKTFRVSYDKGGTGWGGGDHRFQSLGHDPILGFLFGVYDLMTGSRSGFQFDRATKMFSWASESTGDAGLSVLEALIQHVGHLVSDIATKRGLPAPFMPLLQLFNSPVIGEKGRSIGRLARWMYDNGYDLRHFMVGALTPGIIELVVRSYIFIRHWCEHGETKLLVAGDPKYRSMLFWAHGIAAATNAGKVVLKEDPLAVNLAEWQALIRYLGPYLKYWVFDRDRLKLDHLERLTDEGWRKLEAGGTDLLEQVLGLELQPVSLGAV